VASRKILEARRCDSRFSLVFLPEAVEAIQQAFDAEEAESQALREQALALCGQSLPAKSRELLRWRYDEGLQCGRIAQRLNTTAAAVH
jgi:DNA-directed RNA polymerase specialized sigma24 family protein